MRLVVTSAGIVRASETDCGRGLVGWVTVAINDCLLIDGITLRRARSGNFRLSYPARTDRQGRKHSIVRPLTDADRIAIEKQVFTHLGISDGGLQ